MPSITSVDGWPISKPAPTGNESCKSDPSMAHLKHSFGTTNFNQHQAFFSAASRQVIKRLSCMVLKKTPILFRFSNSWSAGSTMLARK